MSRRKRIPTMNTLRKCDSRWQNWIYNKKFRKDMISSIIKLSGRNDVVYRGSAFISMGKKMPSRELIEQLVNDEKETDVGLDIIHPELTSRIHSSQKLYNNPKKYFIDNPCIKNKVNIYLFGYAHDEQLDNKSLLEVHWNCFIYDYSKNKVFIFDPAISIQDKVGYDFPQMLRKIISICITMKKKPNIQLLKTLQPPQTYCSIDYEAMDIFCHSWTIMFVSVYINNAWDMFRRLNFERIQNKILRLWINCLLLTEKNWYKYFQKEKLKSIQQPIQKMLKYCLYQQDEYTAKVVKLPTVKICGSKQNPILSVLYYFRNDVILPKKKRIIIESSDESDDSTSQSSPQSPSHSDSSHNEYSPLDNDSDSSHSEYYHSDNESNNSVISGRSRFGFHNAEWVIYIKEGCPYCIKAKDVLSKYNPKIIDGPTNDGEFRQRVKGTDKSDFSTYPRIFHNGKFIGGYGDLEKYLS